MRTTFFIALLGLLAVVPGSVAQEPVLIAGGSTPPQPVMGPMLAPAGPIPVSYAAPVAYVRPVQIVSGGYYSAPNVIYFGGPNSCYYNTYPGGCYRPGCSYYSPSVIYFGRGEACERGYAFRYPR
jgi:hypothetical protein